jgi:hypothetical protein
LKEEEKPECTCDGEVSYGQKQHKEGCPLYEAEAAAASLEDEEFSEENPDTISDDTPSESSETPTEE